MDGSANKVDIEADIVLAMLQSVAARDYAAEFPEFFGSFGLAVFDEAHHMGGKHFNTVLSKIAPRYILGLTATPDRSDGLTHLLYHGLGPIACRDDATEASRASPCGASPTPEDGRLRSSTATRWLPRAMFLSRTPFEHESWRRKSNGCTTSASFGTHRPPPLHLQGRPGRPGDGWGSIGSTPAARRELVKHRRVCRHLLDGQRRAGHKRLDAEVLATPIGDVTQAVGIHIPCGKKAPVLVDLVDPFSIFRFTAKKRLRRDGLRCPTLLRRHRHIPRDAELELHQGGDNFLRDSYARQR